MSERKELDVLLRNDFYSYVQRVFYELGNEKFIPNWHLEVLCDALERARRGEIKRLIINVPPRSLKSIVVNVAYSTWLLGHNPKERIVSAPAAKAKQTPITMRPAAFICPRQQLMKSQ